LRSALALGALATGLAVTAAQAQPYPPPFYPPASTQAYPPSRPLPGAMVPDDDDDLPAHLRAAPGNYPPPPGGYVFPDDPRLARPAPGGVQREALPAPGRRGTPTNGTRGPAVVYGDRPGPQGYPPAYPPPAYGGAPAGHGQPESYGAAPPPGHAPKP